MLKMKLLLLLFMILVKNIEMVPKPRNCTQQGYLCKTCTNLYLCIEYGGKFIEEPMETCEQPSSCVGGACVNGTSDPYCTGLADISPICRTVGTFPNPFYCDYYFTCVESPQIPLRPIVYKCADGFKYNIATSSCDPLEGGRCDDEYPVPACEVVGQSGALKEKPEMFYVCEKIKTKNGLLYPVLNLCPEGYVYFRNYECVNKTALTTT